MRIAKIFTLGIVFEGFFKSAFKNARFEVMLVKKIKVEAKTKITLKKFISDLRKLGL